MAAKLSSDSDYQLQIKTGSVSFPFLFGAGLHEEELPRSGGGAARGDVLREGGSMIDIGKRKRKTQFRF